MGKIDELKELSANKREAFRLISFLLLAVLSGTGTVIVAVLAKTFPSYMIWIAVFGFVATIFLFILVVKQWRELETLAEEIRDA